jgi:hypothetical protein
MTVKRLRSLTQKRSQKRPARNARPLVLAAFLGAALLPGACAQVGSDSGAPDPEPPCEGEDCAPEEEGCGEAHPCEAGSICQDGACVPPLEEDDLDGGAGAPPMNFGGGPGCIEVDVEFEPVVPTVTLLIDQSGTMNGALGFEELVEQDVRAGGYEPWGCPMDPSAPPESPDQKNPGYRWNVVRSVLFNPEGGIVAELEDEVRFGLTLYTSRGGFGDGETPLECPVLTEVATGLGNSKAMLEAMRCDDIVADTPTREALASVSAALQASEETGPKRIILATDGEPDTCECPFYGESAPMPCRPSTLVERGDPPVALSPEKAAQYDVVEEARRIHDELKIEVHVIDVSAPDLTSLRAHLSEVAEAGGGELFDGTRPTGLTEAFRNILDGARSCSFDLNGTITAGHEDDGRITLDGDELPFVSSDDDNEGYGPDGYIVRSSSQIELVGAPCTTLKSGGHELEIRFPCDSFEVFK